MATYLVLNLVFITIIIAALKALHALHWNRTMTWLLVILIILTATFDSIIIGVGIVDYDPSKLLGVKIGHAPVEDFMYAILALIIVPAIWKKLEERHA